MTPWQAVVGVVGAVWVNRQMPHLGNAGQGVNRQLTRPTGADLGQTFRGSRINGFGPDPLQYGPIWTNPTLSGHVAPDF